MLQETKIDQLVQRLASDKPLMKLRGVDRKIVYDMRNDVKRKVSFAKKLEFLWIVGYIVIKEDGKQ